jgi:hypothetical protein
MLAARALGFCPHSGKLIPGHKLSFQSGALEKAYIHLALVQAEHAQVEAAAGLLES